MVAPLSTGNSITVPDTQQPKLGQRRAGRHH